MFEPVWTRIALQGARRWWLHLLRYGYGAVQMFLFLALFDPLTRSLDALWGRGNLDISGELAHASTRFIMLGLWIQFVAVAVVGVPFLAGEITEEKQRGTLALLLTTPVEVGTLLLGKLVARGAQLLSVLLTGLPLFCFAAVWAGLTPGQVLGQVTLVVLEVYALGALGLLLSVWCRTTQTATLGLYTAILLSAAALLAAEWGLGLAIAGAGARGVAGLLLACVRWLLGLLDPLTLVSSDPTTLGVRWAEAAALLAVIGSVCLAVAAWRLRPVYLRQLEQSGHKREGRAARRPPVSNEPLTWRERHVTGPAALPGLRRLPAWLRLAVVALAMTALALALYAPGPGGLSAPAYWLAAVSVGGLLMVVRGASAVTAERDNGTWDLLLLTPLTSEELIRQVFRGLAGAGLFLVAALVLPGLAVAVAHGDWAMLPGFVAGLPVLLVAVTRWTAVAGLYCSCDSKNWWTSLGLAVAVGLGFVYCAIVPGAYLLVFGLAFVRGNPAFEAAWILVSALAVFAGLEFVGHHFRHITASSLTSKGRIVQRDPKLLAYGPRRPRRPIRWW